MADMGHLDTEWHSPAEDNMLNTGVAVELGMCSVCRDRAEGAPGEQTAEIELVELLVLELVQGWQLLKEPWGRA